MSLFFNEMLHLTEMTIGQSETTMELVFCAVIGLAAFGLTLHQTGRLTKFPMISTTRTWSSTGICLVLMMLAGTASRLYLAPRIAAASFRPWIPLIAAGMVFLLFCVPAVKFLYRTKYIKALSAMILSLIAGAAVIALVHAGFRAARNSAGQFNKTRDRTNTVKEIL